MLMGQMLVKCWSIAGQMLVTPEGADGRHLSARAAAAAAPPPLSPAPEPPPPPPPAVAAAATAAAAAAAAWARGRAHRIAAEKKGKKL
jgi:hypothetical protein